MLAIILYWLLIFHKRKYYLIILKLYLIRNVRSMPR